jgi:hypothetical protein
MQPVESLFVPPTPPSRPADPPRDETLARIMQRTRPERRVLGVLAAAVRRDDARLLDAVIAEALGWPEDNATLQARKAVLLYDMTALLVRGGYMDLALRVAPSIPFAPGMAQVLVFSAGQPQQRYCWRVTPAYALTVGRQPAALPVRDLSQPYQRGEVEIDHGYLERVLLPRRRRPPPILLLPHPLGQVRLGNMSYVILEHFSQRLSWVGSETKAAVTKEAVSILRGDRGQRGAHGIK